MKVTLSHQTVVPSSASLIIMCEGATSLGPKALVQISGLFVAAYPGDSTLVISFQFGLQEVVNKIRIPGFIRDGGRLEQLLSHICFSSDGDCREADWYFWLTVFSFIHCRTNVMQGLPQVGIMYTSEPITPHVLVRQPFPWFLQYMFTKKCWKRLCALRILRSALCSWKISYK